MGEKQKRFPFVFFFPFELVFANVQYWSLKNHRPHAIRTRFRARKLWIKLMMDRRSSRAVYRDFGFNPLFIRSPVAPPSKDTYWRSIKAEEKMAKKQIIGTKFVHARNRYHPEANTAVAHNPVSVSRVGVCVCVRPDALFVLRTFPLFGGSWSKAALHRESVRQIIARPGSSILQLLYCNPAISEESPLIVWLFRRGFMLQQLFAAMSTRAYAKAFRPRT